MKMRGKRKVGGTLNHKGVVYTHPFSNCESKAVEQSGW